MWSTQPHPATSGTFPCFLEGTQTLTVNGYRPHETEILLASALS